MTAYDAAGLVGVALMLTAYAAAQLRRLDPVGAPALLMNLAGASLVMISMIRAFSLAAFVMEAAWAVIALYGLGRLLFTARRGAAPEGRSRRSS